MAAAFIAIGIMIVVIAMYGLRDDQAAAPTKSGDGQLHVGGKHHAAEPHEGGKLAPLQLFAGSTVGEWHAFETLTELGSTEPRKTKTNLVRIDSVDDKQVTLSQSEREGSLTPATSERGERPRQGLTIDQLTGNATQSWTLFGLTITDDVHAIGDRSFACKKLSFTLQDPLDAKKRAQVEMWISAEVPAGGLVELRQTFTQPGLAVTQRLLGFGTADATTWGTKPEGL